MPALNLPFSKITAVTTTRSGTEKTTAVFIAGKVADVLFEVAQWQEGRASLDGFIDPTQDSATVSIGPALGFESIITMQHYQEKT